MKITKFALIATGIILAASAYTGINTKVSISVIPKEVTQVFEAWRVKHNKSYASPQEKAHRLSIFFKSYLKVKNHNNPSYTVTLNKFSDMSIEEVRVKYFGYKRMSTGKPVTEDISNGNPDSFDWRTKGAVTPVKDQGNCGSCWAFSTTGTLEGVNFIANGKLDSLSEQYLVDCSKNGNYGCDGGEMTNALSYVVKRGIPLESAYPYTAEDGRCKKSVAKSFQPTGWSAVTPNSAVALETAVVGRPVAIAIQAD
jgi:C1A family cysteine protease